jgi:PAS domain S-box-containing protein
VHQVELELQNEELRRAQAELQTSRAQYFDLYDLAPVGYVTLSEQGLILQANLAAAALLGVPRGQLVTRLLSRFIVPEDEDSYYLHRQQVLETGAPQACELRMKKMDGAAFWAQLVVTAAGEAEGEAAFRVVLTDITARKQAEAAMRESVQEKELLLKEIHHRVKNNLQIISSLLRLHFNQLDNPVAKAVLQDMQDRVRSIALLHDHLCHSKNLAAVDLAGYLASLCQQLFRALVAAPGSIQLQLDLGPVHLGINQAIPFGLLVNELVSNALKHAFPQGRTGQVRVELQPVEGGPEWRLRVADNGVGLPADFDLNHLTSLGLRLVSGLTGQIDGRLEIGTGPGAVFEVVFRESSV